MAEMETHHQAPQLDTAQRRAEDVLHALRGWEPNLTATAVAKDIHTLVKYAQQVRRLALEEAARVVNIYNCDHDHGKKATKACDDIVELLDRLREGR